MAFARCTGLLTKVESLKKELHIHPVRRGNEKDRRRITIAVLWEYLRLGGDVDEAYFFESDTHHSLKNCNLSCDPLPEERRLEELKRKNRGSAAPTRPVNPLKLVSEGREHTGNEDPDPLVEEIVRVLKSEEVKKDGLPADNSRGRASQGPGYIKECPRPFEKKKGFSLYRPDQI